MATMNFPPFPIHRPRRLRARGAIRGLIQENNLMISDLIWPIFVTEGSQPKSIDSMDGVYCLPINQAVEAASRAIDWGLRAIAIFPRVTPELKTSGCEEAWNPNNLVNRTTRAIRKAVSDQIEIMLDVALDPYNADGHDGLFRNGEVINDATLECLEKQALSHAESGASILGPSEMMDGRIGRIRAALESNGYPDVIIFSYSAKYNSAFYGPFREAIGTEQLLRGSKASYQLDASNSDEALRMVQRDIMEGADAVIIKPGLPYLDLCQRVSREVQIPTFAYQVSGEYAMIKAASKRGWINGEQVVMESLLAFKRAGCRGILTYFAPFVAQWMQGIDN